MNIILMAFALKYKGDWNKIYEALDKKERVDIEEVNRVEKLIEDNNWNIVTIIDREYPHVLKEGYKPPFVVFWKGNLNLLKQDSIHLAFDKINKENQNELKSFAAIAAKTNKVIHTNTTDKSHVLVNKLIANTITVTEDGLSDEEVPKNKLVISEKPYGFKQPDPKVTSSHRISAAISKELLLLSSSNDNGTLTRLVSSYLNLGKDVNVSLENAKKGDLNTELASQGANVINSFEDVLPTIVKKGPTR